MSFLKRFTYGIFGAVFKLLLLLVPVVFALSFVFSTPTNIERAIKESRVYDQFIGSVIDNSLKQTTDQESKSILSQPEVRTAAEKSFTPQVLQTSTESFVEGFYAWLQGKTPEPQFRIDLTETKNLFAQNLAAYAENRANSLPVCTVQQLRLLSPDTDLLSLPCRPPGTDTKLVGQQFSQKFISSARILDNPVITNETLSKENGGGELTDQVNYLPDTYKAVETGKWVLAAVTILLGLALIFARRDHFAGVKRVAWSLLGIGTLMIIGLIIYWFIFDKAQGVKTTGDAVQSMWIDGAQVLISQFNRMILWFSAAYLALGGTLLLFLRLRRPPAVAVPAAPAVDSEPVTSAEQPPEVVNTK